MPRFERLTGLLGLLILASGCGDDVQGRLRLLVVPLHEGRNPVQDPFTLVDRVEVGLTDENGDFHSLGKSSPSPSFGPGLVGPGGSGSPTLVGLNERGRPVSLGFGRPVDIRAGLDEFVSVPFSRVDHALARHIRSADRGLTDPFAGKPPALRLDESHREQGQLESDSDAGCLVWLLWEGDTLLLKARVVDDSVGPATAPEPPSSGDGLTVYLEDLKVTIGADGRVEPDGVLTGVQVETVAGGYVVRIEMPLSDVGKNRQVDFDLRQTDRDGQNAPTLLTWVFDPSQAGQDPEQYGRLVLGVPLLTLLAGEGGAAGFAGADGQVNIDGWWDEDALHLNVDVVDDEVLLSGQGGDLEGADRVEFWLDLANGQPPALEPARFYRVTGTAGGNSAYAAGPDPANVTDLGITFSGQVLSTTRTDGYAVELTMPWSDLQFDTEPQRGWFLGIEVKVVDEDAAGAQTHAWSDAAGSPNLWSEIRLFSVE